MDQLELSLISPLQFLALRVVLDNLPLYAASGELDAYIGLLPLRTIKRLLSYVSSPPPSHGRANDSQRSIKDGVGVNSKLTTTTSASTSTQSDDASESSVKLPRFTSHQWCRSWSKVLLSISRQNHDFCQVIGSYSTNIGSQRRNRILASSASNKLNYEVLSACTNIVSISLPCRYASIYLYLRTHTQTKRAFFFQLCD